MPWLLLTIAGLLEVVWAVGLKRTEGFTRPLASVVTLIAMTFSFVLLAQAVKSIPLGTAYAAWTGIGVVGTAAYGIWKLDEPADALRLACIGLILIGTIGLRAVSPH